jgi:hypothetical protein
MKLICLAMTVALVLGQPASSPEAGAIVEIWNAYRKCLVERDGARAVSLVTPASIADYERVRTLALTLTRAQMLQTDTFDRYMILVLRSRLSGADLRGMSGSDLLRVAVERGWVGSNLPAGVVFKRVEGTVAYLRFVQNGAEVPADLPLVRRVDDKWLVDLVEITRIGRPSLLSLFSKLAEASGTDVNGAMLQVIAKLTGTTPPDTIWDPPK